MARKENGLLRGNRLLKRAVIQTKNYPNNFFRTSKRFKIIYAHKPFTEAMLNAHFHIVPFQKSGACLRLKPRAPRLK